MNEMVKAGQLQKNEPGFIEGEFVAEASSWRGQPSGYACIRCEMPLLVGDDACPRCRYVFFRTTLPAEVVETRIVPEMRLNFTAGRKTTQELKRARNHRRNRPDLYPDAPTCSGILGLLKRLFY